ncbi:uncharacterized protein METZ01_LOCUS468445, partial [marine metagenome]
VGNAASTSQSNNTVTLNDKTAPTITSFSSTTTNGSYNAGDTINITATTSESIQSGNTITVTLDTGDTVVLTAASAGTTLTGTYTVGAGDTSSDLTVSSFAIGTVADAAGNAMTSTAVPSGSNNLGGSSAIVIDTTAPAITGTTVTSNNASIAVTFSEAVYNTSGGSGALEASDFTLTLSGGTATLASATPSSISSSSNTYTLGLSLSGTPNGSETITVVPSSSTAIYDAVGNAASTSQSNNTVTLND